MFVCAEVGAEVAKQGRLVRRMGPVLETGAPRNRTQFISRHNGRVEPEDRFADLALAPGGGTGEDREAEGRFEPGPCEAARETVARLPFERCDRDSGEAGDLLPVIPASVLQHAERLARDLGGAGRFAVSGILGVINALKTAQCAVGFRRAPVVPFGR